MQKSVERKFGLVEIVVLAIVVGCVIWGLSLAGM